MHKNQRRRTSSSTYSFIMRRIPFKAPSGHLPLKKQINGPNDKIVKQNFINPKLHTLINQKLVATGPKTSDLRKKQQRLPPRWSSNNNCSYRERVVSAPATRY